MSLISPNFVVKSIIFPNFWSRAFSQNCWKKPCFFKYNPSRIVEKSVEPDQLASGTDLTICPIVSSADTHANSLDPDQAQ